MKKFDDNSALQSFELIEQVEKLSTQENSLLQKKVAKMSKIEFFYQRQENS